jgi:hypothetical protein
MQNFERIAPILLQIPGMNPEFMAKEALKRMDDGMDITDAIRAALPSIVAMNAQKQLAQGDPAADPNAQGLAGAANVGPGPMAPGADGPQMPASPGDIRSQGVQYPNG